MFCSGSFHHTIMLFDWEISFDVCNRKIWSVTCTFYILFIIHIQIQVIAESFTKMELLFNVQVSDLW